MADTQKKAAAVRRVLASDNAFKALGMAAEPVDESAARKKYRYVCPPAFVTARLNPRTNTGIADFQEAGSAHSSRQVQTSRRDNSFPNPDWCNWIVNVSSRSSRATLQT